MRLAQIRQEKENQQKPVASSPAGKSRRCLIRRIAGLGMQLCAPNTF